MKALARGKETRVDLRWQQPLPGCENLFVLQLLHPGGGGHGHGDDDIVYIKGALTSPPLDRLLLEKKARFIQNIKLDVRTFTKSIKKTKKGGGLLYRCARDALAAGTQRHGVL